MRALISENSGYADRVVECGGKAPGDLRAYCVLVFTNAFNRRVHGVFYYFDREELRKALANCHDVTVRWADPAFQRDCPEFFSPTAAQ